MRKPPVVILHPQQFEFYQYRLGMRFDPGAQAEIFEQRFTNPVQVFRGRGRVAGSLRVTAHPQVYFNAQSRVHGMGTQAGQVMFQPLIDPTSA